MPPLIRLFEPADLASLQYCITVMQNFERAIDPRLRPGAEMAAAYCDELRTRCGTQSGAIFVAEADGEIVGFVAVQARVPFERLDEPPGDCALISNLAVLVPHRRRGVGRALLATAEGHARAHGARTLHIGVLAANSGAAELYRKVGFRPYSELLIKTLSGDPAEQARESGGAGAYGTRSQ